MQANDAVRLTEEISACEHMLSTLETAAEVDPNILAFLRDVLATRRAALDGLQRRPAIPLRLAHLTAEFARSCSSARNN
jgi:hypothetical protein